VSGRVAPQDVVAALYRAADDDRPPWLDGLLIAAGFMRRCPCGAMAPAEKRYASAATATTTRPTW
jgi:hypothetical protein